MLTALLTWITPQNIDRRIDMCRRAARTWDGFSGELVVVNNGGLGDVVRDLYPGRQVIDLSRNYFDVAVHHVGWALAASRERKRFVYAYDDFELLDPTYPTVVNLAMDLARVDSCRLTAYEFGDPFYDTAHTPKSTNPDSVRHECGAGEFPLRFDTRFAIETPGRQHRFAQTNWRPNSRPMAWSTSAFTTYTLGGMPECPVMQPFEAHMYSIADALARAGKHESMACAPGFFRTFPVDTSERTRAPNHFRDVTVNAADLVKEVEKWNSQESSSGR